MLVDESVIYDIFFKTNFLKLKKKNDKQTQSFKPCYALKVQDPSFEIT